MPTVVYAISPQLTVCNHCASRPVTRQDALRLLCKSVLAVLLITDEVKLCIYNENDTKAELLDKALRRPEHCLHHLLTKPTSCSIEL